MTTIVVKLKKVGVDRWRLFAPAGHAISETFHGDQNQAETWAKAWVSSWYNWSFQLDKGDRDVKTNRLPK